MVVLNLGVALWWWSQPVSQVPVPQASSPVGVARLELLPMIQVTKQVLSDQVTHKVSPHCYSVGTFASEAAARVVLSKLGHDVDRGSIRPLPGGEGTGYQLVVTANDNAAAQALAKRIVGAGFRDYYVLGNEVVLGRYRNREGANRLRAELAVAGFQAKVLSGDVLRWEVHLRTPIAIAALQVRLRGYSVAALDCATLR
ncbi:MAG TPA: SPOR domain-containing protein [Xylella sp.]